MNNLKENELEILFQILNNDWKQIANTSPGDQKIEYYKHSVSELTNSDPRIVGYKSEDVEFHQIKTKLNTYYIPAITIKNKSKSNKWIIGVHNFMSNKEMMLHWLINYLNKGYNILSYDISNHGENFNSFNTLGIYETDELMDVVNFLLKDKGAKSINLQGVGVGAFIVNRFILSFDVKKYNIEFAVSDCVFYDYKDYLARTILSHCGKLLKSVKNYNIDTIVRNYISYMQKRFNVSFKDLIIDSLINKAKSTVPVLYITTEKQGVCSIKDSYAFIFDRSNLDVNDTFVNLENKTPYMGFLELKDDYINEVNIFIDLIYN